MTQQQAEQVVRRLRDVGYRAQMRGDATGDYTVDASDWPGDEYYTIRRYYTALELLAILRARAAGLPAVRSDEIIREYEGF